MLERQNHRVSSIAAFALSTALLLGPTAALSAGAWQQLVPMSAAPSSASIQPYSSQPSSKAIKWADKQLKRMSLDEKIGQLISVGVNATFLNQDSAAFSAMRHQVVDNHVGG